MNIKKELQLCSSFNFKTILELCDPLEESEDLDDLDALTLLSTCIKRVTNAANLTTSDE